MVTFGLIDFKTGEKYSTDKAYDGGIDGYHIDSEHRNLIVPSRVVIPPNIHLGVRSLLYSGFRQSAWRNDSLIRDCSIIKYCLLPGWY